MLTRRGLLRGLGAVLAAPAIVRASSLMAISPLPMTLDEAATVAWAETVSRYGMILRVTGFDAYGRLRVEDIIPDFSRPFDTAHNFAVVDHIEWKVAAHARA